MTDEQREVFNAYQRERRRNMSEEQREAYNAYQRRYRAQHRDKARQWQQDYIIRKAAKLIAAKEE